MNGLAGELLLTSIAPISDDLFRVLMVGGRCDRARVSRLDGGNGAPEPWFQGEMADSPGCSGKIQAVDIANVIL
jgi:hypothetical protein